MVHHEILSTPSIPASSGVWTFYGEITIHAPARDVYAALLDFQSYPKWNKYMPKIDTPSGTNTIEIGDMITLHYRPEPSEATMEIPCEIISVSPTPSNTTSDESDVLTLCWKGCTRGIPFWMLLSEKVHRIVPKGENECVFQIYETQARPLAYVIRWTMGEKLAKMGPGIVEGLKGYVEGKRDG